MFFLAGFDHQNGNANKLKSYLGAIVLVFEPEWGKFYQKRIIQTNKSCKKIIQKSNPKNAFPK